MSILILAHFIYTMHVIVHYLFLLVQTCNNTYFFLNELEITLKTEKGEKTEIHSTWLSISSLGTQKIYH